MANKPEPNSITLDTTSVTIMWKDGHRSVYSARQLRLVCPCAQCVEEWTGNALLQPSSVKEGIYAVDHMPIGSYAVQFLWSDAHYTGPVHSRVSEKLLSLRGLHSRVVKNAEGLG